MVKYHIITFGCTLNKSESLRMKYLLSNSGYTWADNPEEADIIIINTCTVKGLAENKVYRTIRKLKNKKIVLAGCLVQHQPEKFKDYPLIGIYNIDKVVEVVDKALHGENLKLLGVRNINKLKIPSLDESPIKIIPIQEGCLWRCSYCATKLARSLMQSFPPRYVYQEIMDAVRKKLPIIYLTGTDLAVYGFDIGIKLSGLLRGISNLDGTFFIRVGMANPGILNMFFDDLLKAYKDPRIFKFFHIPVQTGSNKVLQDMKRRYTVEQFLELVEKIEKRYPYATIATDIIVGYPTETEKDFKETLELIETVKFDILNISRFWPRSKTEAAKLKPLPSEVVKKRSKKVKELFSKLAIEKNKRWLGWEGWIIIESLGKFGNTWIGRNFAYKQIIVKSDKSLLGKFVKVRIIDVTSVDLRGKIIDVKNNIDIDNWENDMEQS